MIGTAASWYFCHDVSHGLGQVWKDAYLLLRSTQGLPFCTDQLGSVGYFDALHITAGHSVGEEQGIRPGRPLQAAIIGQFLGVLGRPLGSACQPPAKEAAGPVGCLDLLDCMGMDPCSVLGLPGGALLAGQVVVVLDDESAGKSGGI